MFPVPSVPWPLGLPSGDLTLAPQGVDVTMGDPFKAISPHHMAKHMVLTYLYKKGSRNSRFLGVFGILVGFGTLDLGRWCGIFLEQKGCYDDLMD